MADPAAIEGREGRLSSRVGRTGVASKALQSNTSHTVMPIIVQCCSPEVCKLGPQRAVLHLTYGRMPYLVNATEWVAGNGERRFNKPVPRVRVVATECDAHPGL